MGSPIGLAAFCFLDDRTDLGGVVPPDGRGKIRMGNSAAFAMSDLALVIFGNIGHAIFVFQLVPTKSAGYPTDMSKHKRTELAQKSELGAHMDTYSLHRWTSRMRIRNSLDLRAFLIAPIAVLTLASCGKPPAQTAPDDTVETASLEAGSAVTTEPGNESGDAAYAAIIIAAVADPARFESDRERDENRKPEAMLSFMEVKPGLSVFEIEAADGYMTELFSRAVGSGGSVVMQNPLGFRDLIRSLVDARLADSRLPNVRASYSYFDALDAENASIDLVTWVLGPHELYCQDECGDVGDPMKAYAEIFRILKPGGTFVAIDHAAAEGSPETTGNDLHRVDPAIVKGMAEQAGFVLEAEGDFLFNPDDPLSVNISEIPRGLTSQFALRFRKPG